MCGRINQSEVKALSKKIEDRLYIHSFTVKHRIIKKRITHSLMEFTARPLHPVYDNDEPLPLNLHLPIPSASLPRVRVEGIPDTSIVISSDPPNYFLIKVTAPSMSEYGEHPLRRAPVDLVMVLDCMVSEGGLVTVDHLTSAVGFVIDQMCPWDRLSIVSPCPEEERSNFPLRRMTDQGKEDAKRAVGSFNFATDYTDDVVEILSRGARVLERRRCQNQVAFIILVSNIKQSEPVLDRQLTLAYLDELPFSIYPFSPQGPIDDFFRRPVYPIYSFGIGLDHEPFSLLTLSSLTGGNYSSLDTPEILKDAIACRIGALLSVVTLEFSLRIVRLISGVTIRDVHTGSYHYFIGGMDRSIADIKVESLSADEVKEFLIEVALPTNLEWRREEPCLNISWTYKDAVSFTGREELFCDTLRVHRLLHPLPSRTNAESDEVMRQKTCSFGVRSICEALDMAERGEVEAARNYLMEQTVEMSFERSIERDDTLCLWLFDEMREVTGRMAGGVPSYNLGGLAYALSTLSSCETQRMTTIGSRVHGADAIPFQPYGTPNMLEMLRRSRRVQG
ncbi:E3 ubiquitin-protein ligase WAV3-like [Andrographis paniculata]|uniref:E3 ubiquitin-protein ligase WAV3-like n=1 Tax=Andrographis paniculata TaxID=175694 RepID=UPI0021E71336|nr:E3 ubiquitin-protein ligase WAV3-like [Andrographis paniculata]